MKDTAVIMMVLSGLCFLPSAFPGLYILVDITKTWAEAQSYCRLKYTDLAAVHNDKDLAKLNDFIGRYASVWIGLHTDTEAWRWSLENQDYYGEGEAEFRMWAGDEPNGINDYKVCVAISHDDGWADILCTVNLIFICYNGGGSPSFILVNESKTWNEAQSYCRAHYTDLASVRNQTENEQIKKIVTSKAWIGLYRDSWTWSDGSAHSFSNWDPSAPTSTTQHICVASQYGKWSNLPCDERKFFVCFADPTVRRVLRVALKKTDSSVDMEELKTDILQKTNQKLKDHGLSEDVSLTWVEQYDGKIFLKLKTEKEKKSCTLK